MYYCKLFTNDSQVIKTSVKEDTQSLTQSTPSTVLLTHLLSTNGPHIPSYRRRLQSHCLLRSFSTCVYDLKRPPMTVKPWYTDRLPIKTSECVQFTKVLTDSKILTDLQWTKGLTTCIASISARTVHLLHKRRYEETQRTEGFRIWHFTYTGWVQSLNITSRTDLYFQDNIGPLSTK